MSYLAYLLIPNSRFLRILQKSLSLRDGIGRHNGLKIRGDFKRPCRFNSGRRYHLILDFINVLTYLNFLKKHVFDAKND